MIQDRAITTQDFLIFAFVAVVFVVTGKYFVPHNPAFVGFSPHPYFVISILLASFYGFKHSVVYSVNLAALYFLVVHLHVDYEEVESLLEVKYLAMPVGMILTSIMVGEMKEKANEKKDNLKNTLSDGREVIRSLKEKENIYKREVLELKQRLVGQIDTASSLFSIARGLSVLDKDELVDNFLSLLHIQVGAAQSAIYLGNANDGFVLRNMYGVSPTDIAPLIDQEQHLVWTSINEKRICTLKDIYDPDQLKVGTGHPIISCPIQGPSGIKGILMIFQMPFLKYIPSNFKYISLLSTWLEHSLKLADRNEQEEDQALWDNRLNVFTFTYFNERLDEEVELSLENKQPLSLIKVSIENFTSIAETKLHPIRKLISEICQLRLRRIDCIGHGEIPSDFLLIVKGDEKKAKELMEYIESEIEQFSIVVNRASEFLKVNLRCAALNSKTHTSDDLFIRLR